ncbi:MAG: hypothetical protein O2917_05670 [Acidobacteria bacterium]|nr:hypothetical protein [Acidobacteriota bacterium]
MKVPSLRAAAVLLSLAVSVACQTPPPPEDAMARMADGTPDLSGLWQAMSRANDDIRPHSAGRDLPAHLGVVDGHELPYLPEALARQQENYANRATMDTEAKCFLPGVPRIMYMPFPFQVVQTPDHVMMLFEYAHATRQIFMDTPHPEGPIEWWMGDSRGHWEGDTLVVDVVHFTNQTWFDRAGNFHSEAMHLVERYTPIGPDHIRYTATIDDPNVFTRPWTMELTLYRQKEPNAQLLDYECYGFVLDEVPIEFPEGG